MNTLRLIFAWCADHPAQAGAILLALPTFLRALLRLFFAPLFKVWPRGRAILDGFLALVPLVDFWRATLKFIEAATGQKIDPYPDPKDEEIARRGSQIVTLQREVERLAMLQPPRVIVDHGADAPPPVGITAGASEAKPALVSIHDTDGSNGEP